MIVRNFFLHRDGQVEDENQGGTTIITCEVKPTSKVRRSRSFVNVKNKLGRTWRRLYGQKRSGYLNKIANFKRQEVLELTTVTLRYKTQRRPHRNYRRRNKRDFCKDRGTVKSEESGFRTVESEESMASTLESRGWVNVRDPGQSPEPSSCTTQLQYV